MNQPILWKNVEELCAFSGITYLNYLRIITVWIDSGTFDTTRGLSYADVMINNGVYLRWPW